MIPFFLAGLCFALFYPWAAIDLQRPGVIEQSNDDSIGIIRAMELHFAEKVGPPVRTEGGFRAGAKKFSLVARLVWIMCNYWQVAKRFEMLSRLQKRVLSDELVAKKLQFHEESVSGRVNFADNATEA